MHTGTKWLVISLAGLAVAALAWFAPPEAGELAGLAQSRDAPRERGPGVAPLLALPARAAIAEPRGELFGGHSWAPPAPAAATVQPAALPPPNPYKFAGKLLQDGAARVFLAKSDRLYEVKAGEMLEGGYLVESIAPDRVVLVYVPLGTRDFIRVVSSLPTDAPVPNLAQLRWEGPRRVRAGTAFSVALRLDSAQSLRALPLQLRYDPELLEPLSVRAGAFFGQGSFSFRLHADGSIFAGASGTDAAPGADAELLVITFMPLKAGVTARLEVATLDLQGAAGRRIAHGELAAFRTEIAP